MPSLELTNERKDPVEFFLCNAIPVGLGPTLLGAHAYTHWLWVVLRILQSQEAHSGYAFPWSPFRFLPLNEDGSSHEAHHVRCCAVITSLTRACFEKKKSLNTGNYGSLTGIWDRLCGTKIHVDTVASRFR